MPTGVVADIWGRRISYLLGSATLLVSTVLYLIMWQIRAPLAGWAIASILIGLGFTFFSGAVEAWIVDALNATDFDGDLETVFGRGQVVGGAAMLAGSIAGGFIAQVTNLGVPYVLRAGMLGLTFLIAMVVMRDLGFTPVRGAGVRSEVRRVVTASIDGGWRNRPIRWVMLAAPVSTGLMFYAFYAMQPYLLELYGDEAAFGVAGVAAAIVAGSQIIGGLIVPLIRKVFATRTNVMIVASLIGAGTLTAIGLVRSFWSALVLLALWGLASSAAHPVREAFINGLIPSEQRATVLSFDALMGSSGGIVVQPALGRVADVWSYSASYLVGGAVQLLSFPFLLLARRERAVSDPIATH